MHVLKVEDDEAAPVVLKCKDCRWSQHDGTWLNCHSRKFSGWADRAATDNFMAVESMRQLYCHGKWWEGRGVDAPDAYVRTTFKFPELPPLPPPLPRGMKPPAPRWILRLLNWLKSTVGR